MSSYILPFYDMRVFPKTARYKGQNWNIVDYDEILVIKSIAIHIEENIVKKIVLGRGCKHPNCDEPGGNVFCLPNVIKYKIWCEDLAIRVINVLQHYNLEDCYHVPREYFEWELDETNEEHKQKKFYGVET